MTKKQLENLLADMKTKLTLAQNNYEAAYADVNRLAQTLDDVESKNRDLQIQKGAMQNKINHLTSTVKGLSAIL
jgi:chromosome segregation ATPase